jgi:hypothetical protein
LKLTHPNWCKAFALCIALTGAGTFASATQAEPPFLLLKLDGAYVKWGDPVLGTGAKVRYALLTDRREFSGARNCGDMTSLDPALQREGIASEQLRTETAAAFAMWQRAANIEFEAVDNPDQADILIGAQSIPAGRAFANVTYRKEEQGATRRIDKALICLNPRQPWKVGFGGNTNAYDLRYTIAHEIGHAIGLNHPGPSGQLMAFKYAESFRGLQTGDLGGAVALYGSRDGSTAASVPPVRTTQPAGMGLR